MVLCKQDLYWSCDILGCSLLTKIVSALTCVFSVVLAVVAAGIVVFWAVVQSFF
jgi:hypothetical protein